MEARVDLVGVRELDARAGDGVEVRLLWQPDGDRVLVHLIDGSSGEAFLVAVEAADALDAFRHPFAYLGASAPERVRVLVEQTRREEVTR